MSTSEQIENARGGFTLVEVIVAFMVLAMVLGSATLSISYSSRLYRKADEARISARLAERLIAERFEKRAGLAEREAGVEGGLRWNITRKALADDYTAQGGRLTSFDLQIIGKRGQILNQYSSMYVERQP